MSYGPSPLPKPSVLCHVVDVHCHPTDADVIAPKSMQNLSITICAMASRQSDQPLVRDLANRYPDKVVPCFGYHPWFTHWIMLRATSKASHYKSLFLDPKTPTAEHTLAFEKLLPVLPEPILLDDILSDLRHNLEAFPRAMLGEVGLDRSFRVAFDYFASPRELTPFFIPLEHQLAILEAQLDVAVGFGRNVSFHSVKCQLGTMELLARMAARYGDRWTKISVDMHSCGLSSQMWREIEKLHPNVFMSLSTVINSRSASYKSLIAACDPYRILVESDFNDVDACTARTWDMIQIVAEVRGWRVEEDWEDDLEEHQYGAVKKLEENWKLFTRGNHTRPPARANHRTRQINNSDVDCSDQ